MKALIYLLQVSACTGIFYLFYYLFLRRLTFFTINRWYLLATLLISFVIPAITIPVSATQPSAMMQPVIFVHQAQVINEPAPVIFHHETTVPKINWMLTIRYTYLVMALISITHLLISLALFFWRMKREKLLQIGNVKVLKADKALGNSSFLNVIFINDDGLEPDEIKQIIAHELLHVKLLHSADRLIARLVQVVLWFNPFAYLYIRAIEENHEFEVDRIAASEDDKGIYATLLFKLAASGRDYLFHGFSQVPIKKRIIMLFNQPTKNMKKMIYVLMLPLVMISCLAFANLKKDDKPANPKSRNISTKYISPQQTTMYKIGKLDGIYLQTYKKNKKDSSAGWYELTAREWNVFMGAKARHLKDDDDDLQKLLTSREIQSFIKNINNDDFNVKLRLPTENELELAFGKYYTRLRFRDLGYILYDKIVIRTKAGSRASTIVAPGAKAGFFIDKTYYSEDAIKKLSPSAIASLGDVVGVRDILQKDYRGVDLHNYQAVFMFTTHDKPGPGVSKYPWEKQIPELSKSFGAINLGGVVNPGNPIDAEQYKGRPVLWIGNQTRVAIAALNGKSVLPNFKGEASAAVLTEYHAILKKYNLDTPAHHPKLENSPFSVDDQKKLEKLYGEMSQRQQLNQLVGFDRITPFKKEYVPVRYFNWFKNQAQYGVWIDNKKVKNSELSKFKASDFDFYDIVYLNPTASKNEKAKYEVNLMTPAFCQQYFKKEFAKKVRYSMPVSLYPGKS